MYLDIADYDKTNAIEVYFEVGKTYRKVEIDCCKGDYLLSRESTKIKTVNFSDSNL